MATVKEYMIEIKYRYACEASSRAEALRKALGALVSDTGIAVFDYLSGRETLEGAIKRFDTDVKERGGDE